MDIHEQDSDSDWQYFQISRSLQRAISIIYLQLLRNNLAKLSYESATGYYETPLSLRFVLAVMTVTDL